MKRFFAFLILCASLWGQALPSPTPKMQFLDQNGHPLAGGFVYTCQSGTACPGNPQATFTDFTGVTPNSNPIVLDAGGFANIWLSNGVVYRYVVQNSNHVQQYVIDGIAGLIPTSPGGAVTNVTATAPLSSSGGSAPNIAAAISGNGARLQTTNVNLVSTTNDVAVYDANGNTADGGVLLSALATLASPTFTGTPVLPVNTIPFSVMTGGSNGQIPVKTAGVWTPTTTNPSILQPGTNGQCVITSGGVASWGSCSGTNYNLDSDTTQNQVSASTTSFQNLTSFSIPAVINGVNKSIHIHAEGNFQPSQTNTQVNFQFLIGAATYLASNAFTSFSNALATYAWVFDADCTVNTSGATGHIQCSVLGFYNTALGATGQYSFSNFTAPNTNINLTGAVTLQVQVGFANASTNNVATEFGLRVNQTN